MAFRIIRVVASTISTGKLQFWQHHHDTKNGHVLNLITNNVCLFGQEVLCMLVSHYIKMDKTYWTHSKHEGLQSHVTRRILLFATFFADR